MQNKEVIEKTGKAFQSQGSEYQQYLSDIFEGTISADSSQHFQTQLSLQDGSQQKHKKHYRRKYYYQNNQVQSPKTQYKQITQLSQLQNVQSSTEQIKQNEGMSPKRFINQNIGILKQYQISEIKECDRIYYYEQNFVDQTVQLNPNQKPKFTDFNGNYLLTEVGRQIKYRYEIIQSLGQGAFGIVLKCLDHKTDQQVAIKIVNNQQCYQDQIQTELQLLQMITQADPEQNCTIKLLDQFVFREHICFVTELLGQSLYDVLQKQHHLDYFKTLQYVSQIIQMEIYISNLNIIHADYKPENILLNNKNELILIDFGSGCLNGQQAYTYIMSRPYRAPEVVIEAKYDIKIDMWSIGCIFYELITGKVLFDCNDQMELLQQMTELLGPLDQELLEQGRKTKQFYTKQDDQFVPKFKVNQNQQTLKQKLQDYNCDNELIDVILACLIYNPAKRFTAQQISDLPYFKNQLINKNMGKQNQNTMKFSWEKQEQNQQQGDIESYDQNIWSK